jgi:hypothetical protein
METHQTTWLSRADQVRRPDISTPLARRRHRSVGKGVSGPRFADIVEHYRERLRSGASGAACGKSLDPVRLFFAVGTQDRPKRLLWSRKGGAIITLHLRKYRDCHRGRRAEVSRDTAPGEVAFCDGDNYTEIIPPRPNRKNGLSPSFPGAVTPLRFRSPPMGS